MEINKRIQQVIDYYGLSKKDFADKIGVSKSTITMITNELQPAGAKVILNTLDIFKEISCEWLIRGEGEMVVHKYKLSSDYLATAEDPPISRTEYKDLLKDIDELKTAIKKIKKDE